MWGVDGVGRVVIHPTHKLALSQHMRLIRGLAGQRIPMTDVACPARRADSGMAAPEAATSLRWGV